MAERVNVPIHPSQLELGHFDSAILLELFPFAIILDREMRISDAGEKIVETWIMRNPTKDPKSIWGSPIADILKLRRPKGLQIDWDTVSQMNSVIFEWELMRCERDLDDAHVVAESLSENELDFAGTSDDRYSEAIEAAQSSMFDILCNFIDLT